MRLRNTSGLPDQLVREVIRFVRPAGISKFDIMVKRSDKVFGGMSYSQGSGYHMTADPFVTVRVGDAEKFPFFVRGDRADHPGGAVTTYFDGRPAKVSKPQTKGYLTVGWLFGRTEALVMVMAHELRHQWQRTHSRGRVWGARGKFSERDADAYAIRMLRAWRREHGIVKD
jgi:hypothetical protein